MSQWSTRHDSRRTPRQGPLERPTYWRGADRSMDYPDADCRDALDDPAAHRGQGYKGVAQVIRELAISGVLGLSGGWIAGAYVRGVKADKDIAAITVAQARIDVAAAAELVAETNRRQKAEQENRDANLKIYTVLEPQLAAAADDAKRLARQLRDALAAAGAARRDAAAAHADQPGAADGAGVPGDQGEIAGPIERATADALAACQRDSDRLAALQAEVRGQL
jgi:hypothetical protein